jgi:hypothetical protein
MAHSAARTIIAPRLKVWDYFAIRLIVPMLAYLPLSLSYTLVNLAFHLPFGGKWVLSLYLFQTRLSRHNTGIHPLEGSS